MDKMHWAMVLLVLCLAGCTGQASKSTLADSSPDHPGAFEATLEGALRLEIPEGVGFHRENRGFYWITLGHHFADSHIAIDFLRKGKEPFAVGRYELEFEPIRGAFASTGVIAHLYGKHERFFEYPVRQGILEITEASTKRIEGRFELTAVKDGFRSVQLHLVPDQEKIHIRGTFKAVGARSPP